MGQDQRVMRRWALRDDGDCTVYNRGIPPGCQPIGQQGAHMTGQGVLGP